MSKLRFYLTVIHIHAQYGTRRQAFDFARRHWRVWRGAEAYTNEPYAHVGSTEKER